MGRVARFMSILIAVNVTIAQDAPQRRAVVPPAPDFQLTNRVVFLLDVSGSMQPSARFDDALQAVNEIVEANTDDLQIAVYAFTDTFTRWPGLPEPDAKPPVPEGWARLPSKPALDAFHSWITSVNRTGNTDPGAALFDALRERRPHTTVVMVTDGEFSSDRCSGIWNAEHQRRGELGLEDTPVVVMDVRPRQPDTPAPEQGTQEWQLEAFCHLTQGGLWALDAPPAPPHPLMPAPTGPW